jgi:hypothetical protein
MNQVLGAFRLLDFIMLYSLFSLGAHFVIHGPSISLIFQFFLDTESADTGA